MAGLIPFNRRNSILSREFGNFYNMIDDFFNSNWPYERSFLQGSFRMDVREDDKEYLIEAELPGIDKKDISLEVNEGRVTISVDRKEEFSEEKDNYIHRERRHSSMCRSVYLADAEDEGIKANLDNGILKISVPKKDSGRKARRIEIE
ncbi:MAG: Hsp20/alpha crystallin family protein [Tissierellaceae bacterium]